MFDWQEGYSTPQQLKEISAKGTFGEETPGKYRVPVYREIGELATDQLLKRNYAGVSESWRYDVRE